MSYAMAEVKRHRKPCDAWVVIHNDVYNVTKFMDKHPGGLEVLLGVAGRDGTDAFDEVNHSEEARAMMNKYKIGSLRAEDKVVQIDSCCKAVIKKPSASRRPKGKSPPRSPAVGRSVSHITVPRESRWWLWLLLAVAVAGTGAFVYKKNS